MTTLPGARLPRSSPEAELVDREGIDRLFRSLDAIRDVHSLMVLRHGRVVAEGWWHPFAESLPHAMFSVSKSFTSIAVGIAVGEGLLDLDDRVVELLPDDAPATPSPNAAAMRVRDLLTMTTGHAIGPMDSGPSTIGLPGSTWARDILAHPVEFEPGTRFVYNTAATYLLSAILQRLTGERLLDWLRPRLFEPLGIDGAEWERDPQGIDVGGFGLSITTEDLAALGQLLLQRGRWGDRQLVPAEWIDAATSFQVDSAPQQWDADWRLGYGYQFWRSRVGYRGDGAFGQFVLVLPEHDAVVAITSGTAQTQAVLDAVWAALLPALTKAGDGDASSDAAAERSLALPVVAGAASSPLEASLLGATFSLAPNAGDLRSLTVGRDADGRLTLTLTRGDAVARIVAGHGEWAPGRVDVGDGLAEVAVSAAWTDTSTLVVRGWFIRTPFARTLTMRFDAESLELAVDQNVSFAATRLLETTGIATRQTATRSPTR